jgi:hypothetical protein
MSTQLQELDIHAYSLAKAAVLTGFHHMQHTISPYEVIGALNEAGVSFVLVGAYGLSGWMKRVRATEDVDVVVAAKHVKKAVRILLGKYPHLEADDHPVVTRLRDKDSKLVAIDVMKPNQQLYRETFKHTHAVSSDGQNYRIPSLEMALAMKFAAMISLHRQNKQKLGDAQDFMYMVDANADIELTRLAELGDLVYPGGGQEIVEKVRQTRAGEILKL